MTIALRRLAALVLGVLGVLGASGCAPPAAAGQPPERPEIAYTIRYDAAAEPAALAIVLGATGLPAAGSVVCRLEDWGEWISAPYVYLRHLQVDGRPVQLDGAGSFTVPAELVADRRLELRYELTVQPEYSAEQEQRRLLPFHIDHHVFAFAGNTFIAILADGAPLAADVTVRVEAAPEQQVFTGWGGLSVGPQEGAAPPSFPDGNGIFAIGRSTGHTTGSIDGSTLEVVQFCTGPDVTEAVAEVARTLIPSFTRGTGRGPRGPVRIFVEGSRGGGTYTDLGLVVDSPGELPLPDDTKNLIAHELFHGWLGSPLTDDESLAWFSEGFTDYLAIWHSAATSLATPDRFAERILGVEREARDHSSLGRVAFAQPGVDWRDDNGPNETMAYRGGALLAFLVDAELRRRSQQSVNAVVRELLASAPRGYQLADIRDAMTKLGIADVYERSIAGTELLPAFPLLVALGYDETVEQAALTYLGIEARFDGPSGAADVVPAVVTAIDSAGPAAKAGIQPGDRILSYGTRRGNPPQLGPEAPPRYQFGLSVIPSGATSVPLELERDGKAMQVEIAPKLVPGGQRVALRWNPQRHTGFFELPPR
ncbi:MAG: hypothetical protein EYC70_13430 [Planctomycetota bacterium]|nr:MAG: hypothetical protein EYC70_13430 [Planctomycetota bacterium]